MAKTKKDTKTTAEDDLTPAPLSLLISAHCSTLKRKTGKTDAAELSFMFDDFIREFTTTQFTTSTYFNSLSEIAYTLNNNASSIPASLSSHEFFVFVRNAVQNLLVKSVKTHKLLEPEIFTLRNCTKLLRNLVKEVTDVATIVDWITDPLLTTALGYFLIELDKFSEREKNMLLIKQITRLLEMVASVQERLPIHLHKSIFTPLLVPTIRCLISPTYIELFKNLDSTSKSFTPLQNLFLIACPHFLTCYYGPHMEQTFEGVLETMLSRYVSILNHHIGKVKEWRHPMMKSMHYLISTLVVAEGYFTKFLGKPALQSLIDHLLTLLKQPQFIKSIQADKKNEETRLIDSALLLLSILAYEADALKYIRKLQPAIIFQKLLSVHCESIVLNSYVLVAYTINERDIIQSRINLSILVITILKLLRQAIGSRIQKKDYNDLNQNRFIIELAETLRSLAHREQCKAEILKIDAVPYLMHCSQLLKGFAKRYFLECLWTLSFDEEVAEQMRQNDQFIKSIDSIHEPGFESNGGNTLRRSYSLCSGRNSAMILSEDVASYDIYRAARGLIWNLVEEHEFQDKYKHEHENNKNSESQQHKWDLMILYAKDDKEKVYQIRDYLASQSYTIWLDDENSDGQTSQVLAEALEKSALIIACISENYKRDNQSQAITKYAYALKRFMIPLLVQKEYKADGWLSSIIDQAKLIDFSGSDLKKPSQSLDQEIARHLQKKVSKTRPSATPVVNGQQINHASVRARAGQAENGTSRSAGRVDSNSSSNRNLTTPTSRLRPRSATAGFAQNGTNETRLTHNLPPLPVRSITPGAKTRGSNENRLIQPPAVPLRIAPPIFYNSTTVEKSQTTTSQHHSRSATLAGEIVGSKSRPQTPGGRAPSRSGTSVSRNTPSNESMQPKQNIYGSSYLSPQYLNRDTSKASYRNIPTQYWEAADVLDFFYDINLNILMPLFEKKKGPTIKSIFRQCQTNPSLAHSNLNKELQQRFGNLTLPANLFSQLLFEIDDLLGPLVGKPPLPPRAASSNKEIIQNGFPTRQPPVPPRAASSNREIIQNGLPTTQQQLPAHSTAINGGNIRKATVITQQTHPTHVNPMKTDVLGNKPVETDQIYLNGSASTSMNVTHSIHNATQQNIPINMYNTDTLQKSQTNMRGSPTKYMTYIPVEARSDSAALGYRRMIQETVSRPVAAGNPRIDATTESDEEVIEILELVDRPKENLLGF